MQKSSSATSKLTEHANKAATFQQFYSDPRPQQMHFPNNQPLEIVKNELNLQQLKQELNQIELDQPALPFQRNPLENVEIQSRNWISEFDGHRLIQPDRLYQPNVQPEMVYQPKIQPEYEAIYRPQENSNWMNQIHQFDKFTQMGSLQEWDKEFKKYKEIDMNINIDDDEIKQEINNVEQNIEKEESQGWNVKFQEIWNTMQENSLKEDLQKDWAQEFGNILQNIDEVGEVDPVLAEAAVYSFEVENPYLQDTDPYSRGIEILESRGNLSMAALAFEAAVQKDIDGDKGWMMLGRVQAENEKESPAVAALQKCVQNNPHNLEALMMLAVSYTNEGMYPESFATLDRWLRTSYPDLMSPRKSEEDIHARLVNYFIEAVSRDSANPNISADLQVGLGLLFYNSHEYDKTIDCFTAALSINPNDYLLWNRLGATLSNSGDNEKAIEAYGRALELNPTFVRARYNLGVSCMNIGCYKEAAEHYLTALSLHQVNGQKHHHVSTTLWDTLRRNFIMMERLDLADLIKNDANIELFRKDFEF